MKKPVGATVMIPVSNIKFRERFRFPVPFGSDEAGAPNSMSPRAESQGRAPVKLYELVEKVAVFKAKMNV